jgi:glycosyltransferase involved in cell wall biosynthesis
MMTGMRVLHVVSRSQRRGAETVALELAAELDALGHHDRLVALAPDANGETIPDLPLLTGRGLGPIDRMRSACALRREVRRWKPAIVLAHGGTAAMVAAIACRRTDTRVVWHRILELGPQGRRRSSRLVWRAVVKRIDAAVAITDHLADEMHALGFAGPVWRIPNMRRHARFSGLDRAAAGAALRAELGISNSTAVVGFVGHLVDQKRPERAVSALGHLRTAGTDAHLVVVGDGPRRATVEAAVADAGLGGHVTLLGHRADVPALLAGIDVLVVTSESESMTGTVVEAQMAGCPVVSYPLDGADDAIVNGCSGIVLTKPDTAELALEVAGLVRDPARLASFSHRAAEHGATFATEVLVHEYDARLRELVGPSTVEPPVSRAAGTREDDGPPVRVLYLLPNFGVGGAERSLLVIARHLDRSGAAMFMAALGPPRRPVEETVLPQLEELGVDVIDLAITGRADRSPRTLVVAARRLRRLCRDLRIDVVDSALFEADLVTRLALLGTRVRHVVHIVNTTYDAEVARHAQFRGPRRLRAARALDAATARLTDHFVAITDSVADAARRDLRLADRVLTTVPRGVDLTEFPALGPPAPDPDGTLRLLAVGRLVPQKAHETLVRAVAVLRKQGVAVRLTIAGEGPLRGDLEALAAELDVADVVALPGPSSQVVELHRTHDVFCFPSRWEGLGNALLEAMACERPVVATDIPTMREVAGPRGIFAPVDDPVAWAEAIASVAHASQEERAELGAAMRARVAARYAAPKTVADLVDVSRAVSRG